MAELEDEILHFQGNVIDCALGNEIFLPWRLGLWVFAIMYGKVMVVLWSF